MPLNHFTTVTTISVPSTVYSELITVDNLLLCFFSMAVALPTSTLRVPLFPGERQIYDVATVGRISACYAVEPALPPVWKWTP